MSKHLQFSSASDSTCLVKNATMKSMQRRNATFLMSSAAFSLVGIRLINMKSCWRYVGFSKCDCRHRLFANIWSKLFKVSRIAYSRENCLHIISKIQNRNDDVPVTELDKGKLIMDYRSCRREISCLFNSRFDIAFSYILSYMLYVIFKLIETHHYIE